MPPDTQFSLPILTAVNRGRPPRLVGSPPLWRRKHTYSRWQWVTDGRNVQLVVKEGTSGDYPRPSWKYSVGEITKDPPKQNGASWNGVEWKNLGSHLLTLLQSVPGSLRLFQLAPAIDTEIRDPFLPYDYIQLNKVWKPSTAFRLNDDITDGTNIEVVVTPGTSGTQRPTWSAIDKQTIDGTVVWKNVGAVVLKARNPAFDQDIRNPGKSAAEGCPVNFGPDPDDPAGFSTLVDPGSALCSILSGYAVAGCSRARGGR